MTDKTRLRRELRRRRKAVPARERRRAERAVARRALPFLRPGRHIAAYVALGSELALAALIALAQARGCKIWLPLLPKRGRHLQFAALDDPHGIWRRNRYGIAEYHAPSRRAPRRLDTVFLPLVGFDADGGRLGQGGGYYDSTFAFRASRHGASKPRLVGVGFDCQRLADLPREPHDALLDWVLSERAAYRCRVKRLPRQAR